MFKIYDQYLLRQLLVSTFIVSAALSMIILLTQSLKLIELVLQSNASGGTFLALMGLSIPRFFEAVLPASVLISTLFVIHRLSMDSEMIILKASGLSPMRMARPMITGALIIIIFLLNISLWLSPAGIAKMHIMRNEIKSEYAHLLFKEGIFNTVGRDLTAYVRAQSSDGRLLGLVVHDTRAVATGGPIVTVIAESGQLISENNRQKIIVYDGSRQEMDPETKKFSRLDFQQYTLDIPNDSGTTSVRWHEPDERTISELIDPLELAKETPTQQIEFWAEFHRRMSTPLLLMSFALVGAACLLLGPFSRAGQMPLLISAAVFCIAQQGVYLFAFNLAKKSYLGCASLYLVAGLPALIALYCLTPSGEYFLRGFRKQIRSLTGR